MCFHFPDFKNQVRIHFFVTFCHRFLTGSINRTSTTADTLDRFRRKNQQQSKIVINRHSVSYQTSANEFKKVGSFQADTRRFRSSVENTYFEEDTGWFSWNARGGGLGGEILICEILKTKILAFSRHSESLVS